MNVLGALIAIVLGISMCVSAMIFGIRFEEHEKLYKILTLPSAKEFCRKQMKKNFYMMIVSFICMVVFIVSCFIFLFA